MKASLLGLWSLFGLPEHFTGARKIKAAVRNYVLQRGKQVVRPVDIGLQSREFVVERVADEALGRKVVALIGQHVLYNPIEACVAFQRRRMQGNLRPYG